MYEISEQAPKPSTSPVVNWIDWHGGDNPVPGKTVQVIFRNGQKSVEKPSDKFVWHHVAVGTTTQLLGGSTIHIDEDFDIVSYRTIP